jgi:UDP-N-acetylmuramoyl-L-alanyl-D-glutamate--2,6-diaminopimelate ligase
MKSLLKFIKNLLGKNLTKKIRPLGHGIKGVIASIIYGSPSDKLILIGINGTKGKTTTTVLTARLLNSLNQKTGFISSALINDGDSEYINPYKMGMIDGLKMFQTLKKMVKNGCKYAVLEMTSEGLAQNRWWGLTKFDTVVFLNAFPEHLEAHGGWENYLKAKGALFSQLDKQGNFIGNGDPDQLLNTQKMFKWIPQEIRSSINKIMVESDTFVVLPNTGQVKLDFTYNGVVYKTNFISRVEIHDLVFAINVAKIYVPNIQDSLESILPSLEGIPGRMEWVVEHGQIIFNPPKILPKIKHWQEKVSVLVDYAHEPESMKKLFELTNEWKQKGVFTKVIHILSCDGVGRDDWKKPVLGRISYENADYTILTTDNYSDQDNPEHIVDILGSEFDKELENKKYYKEIDRYEAFQLGFNICQKILEKNLLNNKILLVSTGVGSEKGLTRPGQILDWDERIKWVQAFLENNI